MAYEHNNQSNGSEGYGSYSYNGKDEYYLNNYRGSGGGGGYRGSRGRGSRGNNYYGNSYRGGSIRGGGGYYKSYNNNYYGGRGGGHRSYSNYHDQGNDTAGSSTTSSQNGEYESQDNTQETEHSYSSRPHISGFHRGSYRGGFRGSYRGRGGGGSFNNGLAATASPTTTRHYKDIINENKLKNFNNPWINIMRIEDEPTQNKLEKSYNDMTELDSSILELQKSKLKLEMSMSLIEKQIDKEGLHVELTNEKLEEFAYL